MIVWLDMNGHNAVCPFGFRIAFDHALVYLGVIVEVYLKGKENCEVDSVTHT